MQTVETTAFHKQNEAKSMAENVGKTKHLWNAARSLVMKMLLLLTCRGILMLKMQPTKRRK